MTRSAPRVAEHRARLRAQGLRPVQIWVPDTRAPGFAAEAHRQSLAVAKADDFDALMDWAEAHAADWGDADDAPDLIEPR
jgi:hypothetical protein